MEWTDAGSETNPNTWNFERHPNKMMPRIFNNTEHSCTLELESDEAAQPAFSLSSKNRTKSKMRMGIANKKLKGRKKKPLFQTDEQADSEPIVVSQLSSNLIDGIYSVQFTAIAEHQAELYAEALLEHEDQQKTLNETTGQEIVPFPDKFLFSSSESRQELQNLFTETATHFYSSGRSQPWKVHANAAKFERSLNEKYGRFRPIINKYPQIETFLRKTQRSYSRGEYSPFRQGDPPFLDKKSSIILLFMMHRNGCQMETVALTAIFFLVGLQPWALVLLIILGRKLMDGRKKKRVAKWVEYPKPVQSYYNGAESDKAKHDLLNVPVGEPLSPNDFKSNEVKGEETYDTLLVGSGPATMFTAALLSRTGKTVLVLSPDKDASGVQMICDSTEKKTKFENVTFDVHPNNVAHTSRQQELLAPALCTTTDAQGGIRFAEIGSPLDGYTSDLLSIPGVGVDSPQESTPYAIRAGKNDLAEDAAIYLGDAWPNPEESSPGKSTSLSYLSTCSAVNATSSQYYLSKLLPDKFSKMIQTTSYQESSVRYASGFLDSVLPLNSHVRSLMAAMGMRGENLPPGKASMAAHISHVSAFAGGEGFTYPIGGPRALCKAFESVVTQNGGKVVTNARIKEFLFNEDESANKKGKTGESEENKDGEESQQAKPRCHGVSLVDGRTVSVGADDDSSVISMLGFVPTFIFHMEDKIRSKYGIPAGVPSLEERRPLLHFLIALNGNSDDLSLTGADWYRLPNASLAIDERNPETGEVVLGTIGKDFIGKNVENVGEDVEEENKESGEDSVRDKRTKMRPTSNKQVFTPGKSWMKVSFPSAKDPSWRDRHGDVSTCVVTIEADDSFVRQFDTSPKVYSNIKYAQRDINLLLERVTKDLLVTFPQLNSKIERCRMIGPERVGLSHTPQRYAAKGIRPATPYPGLFVGGSDLTVGDSFSAAMVSGWMVSNAVLGYSFVDLLYLQKNVTDDLKRFLKCPEIDEEEIAVPFSPKSIEESIDNSSEKKNEEDAAEEQAAESSKEE